MNDFSLVEKIDILMKLVSSSSLFLICSIIGIFLLIFFIFCIIFNKKINKYVFVIIILLISIILLINYGTLIVNILDSIFDSLFMALYFPSLPIYSSVLIILNISFVLSIFSRKQTKLRKIINITIGVISDFFLILIIDIVSKNNINIYEQLTLYSNQSLLVLFELSMGLFVSWILLNLLLNAHIKLKKYDEDIVDKIEEEKTPEIIFD